MTTGQSLAWGKTKARSPLASASGTSCRIGWISASQVTAAAGPILGRLRRVSWRPQPEVRRVHPCPAPLRQSERHGPIQIGWIVLKAGATCAQRGRASRKRERQPAGGGAGGRSRFKQNL